MLTNIESGIAAFTSTLYDETEILSMYLLPLKTASINLYSEKFRRPILWGPAAASHHQITKSLGPSLWQQPSVTEVLEQLDASKMNQSAVVFPQNRHLQVCKALLLLDSGTRLIVIIFILYLPLGHCDF